MRASEFINESFYKSDIQPTIEKNPSKSKFSLMLSKSPYGEMRGFLGNDNNLYIWPEDLTHHYVTNMTGIFGLEIRFTHNGIIIDLADEYFDENEYDDLYNEAKEELRSYADMIFDNENIIRIFGKNINIVIEARTNDDVLIIDYGVNE
jgi:hypothetical protein